MTQSVLVKKQVKAFRKDFTKNGKPATLIVKVRWDDECGNGHNSFAVTGDLYETHRHPHEPSLEHNGTGRTLWLSSCGCMHDTIAEHFPELVPAIKFHLCGSDGPWGYIGNTVFLAGDRDCWGLRKGEFRQHTSRGQQNGGVPGVPCWELTLPKGIRDNVYADEKPAPVVLEWQPYGRTGDGKERELDKARSTAIWPDATDDDLTAPGLEDRLQARLPALMEEFRQVVESFGFTY